MDNYGLVKLAHDDEDKKLTSGQHAALGAASTLAGTSYLGAAGKEFKNNSYENFYHGTSYSNAKDIREHGLLASKAGSGQASTQSNLSGRIGEENVKGKVYMTRDPGIADYYAQKQSRIFPFDTFSTGEKVEIKVPKRHFDKGFLKEVPNPELEGMTPEELTERDWANPSYRRPYEARGAGKEEFLADTKALDAPFTTTIEGDIPTRYIVGSKDFKGANLADITHAIRKYPKQFIPAMGATGLGLAALGIGANQFIRSAQNE
jgi:hypothetical protein